MRRDVKWQRLEQQLGPRTDYVAELTLPRETDLGGTGPHVSFGGGDFPKPPQLRPGDSRSIKRHDFNLIQALTEDFTLDAFADDATRELGRIG